MNKLCFLDLDNRQILLMLRAFKPAWANKMLVAPLKHLLVCLNNGSEEALIEQAGHLSARINDMYVWPNFRKSAPLLTCCVTEDDAGLGVTFNIPLTLRTHLCIRSLPHRMVVNWPEVDSAYAIASYMATLVFGNGLSGVVILDEIYRLSYRACLLSSLANPFSGPLLDMAGESDNPFPDYLDFESKVSVGKSLEEFLEL